MSQLKNRSIDRQYTIRILLEARYPPHMPAVDIYSGLVDKMSFRHPSLRDARQRLTSYHERVSNGGELTEYELEWIDWFSWMAFKFNQTGELPGHLVETDGVWGFELDGSKLLDQAIHRNP